MAHTVVVVVVVVYLYDPRPHYRKTAVFLYECSNGKNTPYSHIRIHTHRGQHTRLGHALIKYTSHMVYYSRATEQQTDEASEPSPSPIQSRPIARVFKSILLIGGNELGSYYRKF